MLQVQHAPLPIIKGPAVPPLLGRTPAGVTAQGAWQSAVALQPCNIEGSGGPPVRSEHREA